MSTSSVTVDTLPSLPVHALQSAQATTDDINRSASFTSLPGLLDGAQGIKRTFSDNVLSSLGQKPTAKVSASVQNANVELFRRASHKTKKRMSAAKFVSPAEIEETERAGRQPDRFDVTSTKSGKGAGALKMFSRKTWLSSSRPQSPNRRDVSPKKDERRKSATASSIQTIAVPEPVAVRPSPRSSQNSDNSTLSSQDAISIRRDSSSPTPPSHTTSEYSAEVESDAGSKRISRRSSFSSVRSRASIDRMYLSVPTSKIPPLPTSASSDRLAAQNKNRQQDPHWIAFRAIDGEYASFQSKTSMQKAKVVRTVLLPFLSKTSDKASITSLRAEDLDRRIAILNKWWTGLVDLLNGTGQQSISGTDRPAFLEAICEIMIRPEWKIAPFSTTSEAPAETPDRLSKTESQDSSDSEDPEFLIRTIYQNVRNLFVQNIINQLAFVVDKLSMRAAPGSLIIFGGKTLGYAFFYCPGVADILVRLWHIPPGTLRRVLNEYGTDTGRKAAIISRTLASSFPPPIRSLCFTSQIAMSRQLQSKGQVPPDTAHIRWHGPWVNRWSGRDSDLFYVFVKHYHLLAAAHLPRHLLPEERMGIPAFVVVHAQILLNLESAVYRQAGNFAAEHYAPQAGENPDAMAPLPMVVPNATRTIGENRLVMLLRDCMADRKPESAALAEILVGPFQYIMKAVVRKVSMYNNDACFILSDFLEELVPIIAKYQRFNVEEEDWEFWLKVYKQMMQSQSTMTQIRLIAFIYTTWPSFIINEERKEQVILNWLLEPKFFSQFFNHWSPMVRHYYFRLLCWRVGRCDGNSSEMDFKIYQRLMELLNKAWAQHQYITADAEMRGISPPSTNPCAPAPGRGLIIIRTDSHHRGNDFSSFDKLMPASGMQSPYTTHSSLLSKVPEADTQQNTSKKRWNILKNISLFSSPTNSRPGEVTPPRSPDSAADVSKKTVSKGNVSRPPSPPPQVLHFNFKLEYVNVRPGLPAKVRKLPLPQLPHTTQKLLDDMRKLEQLSSTETLVKDIRPRKPAPEDLGTTRYSGRALSEWALVVQECRNFFVRRKQEGCPSDKAVETPAIAVESFRMFG